MMRTLLCLAGIGIACGNGRAPATDGVAGDTTAVRFVSVAAGQGFTCALAEDGRVFCWGSTRLANGSTREEWYPRPIPGGYRFTAITAGEAHACALEAPGRAYCWGYALKENGAGALGSDRDTSAVPVPVATELRFTGITAGPGRTCALTREGSAYCWGLFTLPSTGADRGAALTPTAIPGGVRFRALSAGGSHACGIAADGRVYCWGESAAVAAPAPARPLHANDTSFTFVSTSPGHSCEVDQAGDGYCWGGNSFGELGNGQASGVGDEATAAPTLVTGGYRWRLIRTGGVVTCGLTLDGAAYCWGANFSFHPLGGGPVPERCAGPPLRECSSRPVPVSGGLRFRDLSIGAAHTCGVTADGELYCWGDFDQPGGPFLQPTPVKLQTADGPAPPRGDDAPSHPRAREGPSQIRN